jgi:hypothetical protein
MKARLGDDDMRRSLKTALLGSAAAIAPWLGPALDPRLQAQSIEAG